MLKYEVAKLLAKDMPTLDICTSVGISPKGLTVLMSSPEFMSQVATLKDLYEQGFDDQVEADLQNEILDSSWNALEEKAVAALNQKMDAGLIIRTGELLSIARLANSAGRRNSNTAPLTQRSQAPVLEIGEMFIQNNSNITLTTDNFNRVIGIGDTPLQAASKSQIDEHLNKYRSARKTLALPDKINSTENSKILDINDCDPEDL